MAKPKGKVDWIKRFPNLFPGAVLYDAKGRKIPLNRKPCALVVPKSR